MPKNALKIVEKNPNTITISIGNRTISFIKVKQGLMWREILPPGKGKKKEWISESLLDEAYKLARENLFTNSKI